MLQRSAKLLLLSLLLVFSLGLMGFTGSAGALLLQADDGSADEEVCLDEDGDGLDDESGEACEDEDDEESEDNSDNYFCQNPDATHPVGEKLADTYDVDYATVMGWFCEGYGFGQIMLALETSQITGQSPDELLAARAGGAGWGQIWQEAGLIGKPEDAGPPPWAGQGKPDWAGGPPDDVPGGPPEDAGPPDDVPGGPPDDAPDGPPDDKGGPP
jgi:hypothetical protein